ncbi:hypothetical protein FPQ18DRAFT_338722 [Pyronema domesticum]|nr:hypothetical protein FPQ18DRAFT_338722 [Pyronema domesticum]
MEPTPSPAGPETQDTPLPDAPTTAPEKADGWKTVEGKATQRRKQKATADKKRTKEASDKPPTTKNGGRGKNSHRPRPNNTSTKKTWADVVKSGGINVQIVLGKGNLGLTTPTKKRGERRGGAARRLENSGGTACLYPRGVDFTIILTQSSAPPLDAGVNWRFQFSKVPKLESWVVRTRPRWYG